MPTLVRPTAADTQAPGLTRRRVWHPPAVRSHSLVLLTLTKLYLAPSGATLRPEAIAAIQTAFDLDGAFGPMATVIDLSALTRVKLDLLANTLTLDYRPPAGEGGHTAQATILFATPETADEVYAKLWRRIGDRFRLRQHRPPAARLARTPVAVMAGVLLAAVTLALLSSAAADTAADAGFALAVLRTLDWRVVCGVGGAVLAVLQVWLYRRLTQPPVRLELVRDAG